MMGTSLRAKALACTFLAGALFGTPAVGQTSGPLYRNFDGNGVDVVRGDYLLSFVEGSIGSGAGRLALERRVGQSGPSQWDGVTFTLSRAYAGATPKVSISLPTSYENFTLSGTSYVSATQRGTTLDGGFGSYTFTAADGT